MNTGTANLLNQKRSAASPIIACVTDVGRARTIEFYQAASPKSLPLQPLVVALLDKYVALTLPLEIQAAALAGDAAECRRPATRVVRGGRVVVPLTRLVSLLWDRYGEAFLSDLRAVTAGCRYRYETYRGECINGTAVPPYGDLPV